MSQDFQDVHTAADAAHAADVVPGQDTTSLQDAITALQEALKEPATAKSRARRPKAPAMKPPETVRPPPDLGDTLLYWKDYDSRPYVEKGQPAWHESPRRPTPRAPPPPTRRDWSAEAAAQRRLLKDVALPQESMAMDMEVQFRSKERLRRLLRTGQLARVKKEFEASLPPVPKQEERRPSRLEAVEEGVPRRRHSKEKSKAAARKMREGDAAEALRMMTCQRNELAKARRALEQIVDTRQESDKKLEKLQQVLAKYSAKRPSVAADVAVPIHEHFHHLVRDESHEA